MSESSDSTLLKWPRWVKWMLYSFVTVILIPFTLFVTISFFKPEIVSAVNSEISKRFNAVIQFDDLDITLFRTFPKTSVLLEKLSVKNPLVADSVLLVSEKLYLSLDFWSLLRGEILFDGIRIDRAEAHVITYENGTNNWAILNSSSDTSAVSIDHLVLNDCYLKYNSDEMSLISSFPIDRCEIKGDFLNPHARFDVNLSFGIDSLLISETSYKCVLPMRFMANHVERTSDLFEVKDLDFELGDVTWQGDLKMAIANDMSSALRLSTVDADLHDLIEIIPEKFQNHLSEYAFSGNGDFRLDFQWGPKGNVWNVSLDIKSGVCEHRESENELREIDAQIDFSSLKGGYCEVKKCTAYTANGELRLAGRVDLSGASDFVAKVFFEGPLTEISLLAPSVLEYKPEGETSINAEIVGTLFQGNTYSPSMISGVGYIVIDNGRVFIPSLKSEASNIQLQAELDVSELNVKSIDFLLNESHFKGSGQIMNPLRLMSSEASLDITGLHIHVNEMDINSWISASENEVASVTGNPADHSMDYSLQGTFTCGILKKSSWILENFNADYSLRRNRLELNNIQTQMADGNFKGELRWVDKFFSGDFICEDIDIQQLFQQGKDFGQSNITAQNMEGILSGTTSIDASITDAGSFDLQTLKLHSDIVIERGRLKNYSPVIQLADFIQLNRLLSVFVNEDELRSKLTDIEFHDLKNTIHIQEGEIIIPEMKIESNAFDITARGRQTFSGVIDYNIGINIFQLIRDRDRGNSAGRNNIFIHMYGNSSSPRFEVEREMIKLPEIKLPSFLKEPTDHVSGTDSQGESKNTVDSDTLSKKDRKLPSLVKNKNGETRKWLREKN